jgi:hypothetical protein
MGCRRRAGLGGAAATTGQRWQLRWGRAAAAAGGALVPEPACAIEDKAAREALRCTQAPARCRHGRQRQSDLPQQEAVGRGTPACQAKLVQFPYSVVNIDR